MINFSDLIVDFNQFLLVVFVSDKSEKLKNKSLYLNI